MRDSFLESRRDAILERNPVALAIYHAITEWNTPEFEREIKHGAVKEHCPSSSYLREQ